MSVQISNITLVLTNVYVLLLIFRLKLFCFFECVFLGEDYRAFKGPKGEGRQRASGRSGLLQKGKQGPEGESQQPANRINRERGQ